MLNALLALVLVGLDFPVHDLSTLYMPLLSAVTGMKEFGLYLIAAFVVRSHAFLVVSVSGTHAINLVVFPWDSWGSNEII